MEDDIESREEFWRLLPLSGGDRDCALGKLVRFFRVGQKRFGRGQPITESELQELGLMSMIESGWALPIDGGYQALGAEKQFEWYSQKVEAGRKRASGRRDSCGKFTPAESSDSPADAGKTPATHQPLTLAPAPAPTLKKKKKEEEPKGQSVAIAPVAANSGAGTFIGLYVRAYQKRYGEKTRPDLRGKTQGLIKRYLAETALERACNMIEVYCQMDEPWFKTKCHDFVTFLENQSKVGIALDTGADPGKPVRRGIEEMLAGEGGVA